MEIAKLRSLTLLALSLCLLQVEIIAGASSDVEKRLEKMEMMLQKFVSAMMDDRRTVDQEISGRHAVIAESMDDVGELSIEDIRYLIRGRDGRDGRDGEDGADGKDGADGVDGTHGLPGTHGAPGLPGRKGDSGSNGTNGTNGINGTNGRDGAPGDSAEAGSTYIRWGRKSCNGDASLIYNGFAAGGHYNSEGNGANHQCLHPQPEYNAYYTGSGIWSYISGGEFQTYGYGIFPSNTHQQNVPCALCFVPRSATMMIPSRRTCPPGWNKEYEGYLMSERNTYKHTSTYECVDQNPDYVSGQHANNDGALFYFVKPDCSGAGTIGHCPPYDGNKQLTCVVCSK